MAEHLFASSVNMFGTHTRTIHAQILHSKWIMPINGLCYYISRFGNEVLLNTSYSIIFCTI